MRTNEIKRTVEEVVRVEYIAEDGQVFRSEEECKKYEESALFAISKQMKRMTNKKFVSQYDINDDCSDEYEVEIFNAENEKDIEEIPATVRKDLELVPISHADEALFEALCIDSKEAFEKLQEERVVRDKFLYEEDDEAEKSKYQSKNENVSMSTH